VKLATPPGDLDTKEVFLNLHVEPLAEGGFLHGDELPATLNGAMAAEGEVRIPVTLP
jgi:hypothetical protein